MSVRKDYYKLLGISKESNPDEIKKAYHQLAKKCHPDKNPNDPSAADKFKAIKEAYENLSDPNKKVIYDEQARAPTHSNVHVPAKDQTRYKTSTFTHTFNATGGTNGTSSHASGTYTQPNGARVFTFNVYKGNVPMEEVFRVFFGGMPDFGSFEDRQKKPKPPPNPNAVASCDFCRELFTVPDLIIHQKICSKRPLVDEDYRNKVPDDDVPITKINDWRKQHQETVDAIRRDRQRAGSNGTKTSSNPPASDGKASNDSRQSGYVICPTCSKRFNVNIATRHIQFCKQKTHEDTNHTNKLPKDHSSFKKAKEYAENIRKQKHGEDNNSNNDRSWNFESVRIDDAISDCSDTSCDSEDSESDEDALHCYWNSSPPECTSSRSHRRTTLPNLDFYKKMFANRPRRFSSATVYENSYPSFSTKMNSYREGRGCPECIRIYGLKAANVYCSCRVKRSTNVRL